MKKLGAALVLFALLQLHACSGWSIRSLLQNDHDGKACGVSELGYACYLQVCPSIALHWTFGGPPPDENCRMSANSSSTNFDAATDLIHIALVTDVQGYVAFSLPKKLGVMAPADSIIGIAGGDVKAYHLQSHRQWTSDSAIHLQNVNTISRAGQGLTVCMSRPFAAVGAAGGRLTMDQAVGMNFAASDSPHLARHMMDSGHLCGVGVNLMATAQEGGHMVDHMHSPSYRPAVVAHAVMMVLAWLVLLPCGVMAARHRWLFPESTPPKTNAWFLWHRGFQLAGLTLFGAAFLLPFVAFGGGGHSMSMSSMVYSAHKVIGITLACVAGTQLLLAFVRPKPDAEIRKWWNMQHWYTGRVAVLLAPVNILLGVQVFHEMLGESRLGWNIPVIILLCALTGLSVWLEIQKAKRAEAWLNLSPPEIHLGDRTAQARQVNHERHPLLHAS